MAVMDLNNIRERLDNLSLVDCPSNRIAKELLTEAERLRFTNARMTETIAAFPDAHDAANLAHARRERDELRTEVKRLRAMEERVRQLAGDPRFEVHWRSPGGISDLLSGSAS